MIDRDVAHPPLVFAAHDSGRPHHCENPFPFGRAVSGCDDLDRSPHASIRRAGVVGTLAKRRRAIRPHEDRSAGGNGTPFEAPVARCAPALAGAGA